MKTKILLVMMLMSVKTLAVENSLGDVDNGYNQKISCQTQAEGASYELILKFKNKVIHDGGRAPHYDKGFSFVLKNITTGETVQNEFSNYIYESASFNESDESFTVKGKYAMYLRFGYQGNKTVIDFDKSEGQLTLNKIKIESLHCVGGLVKCELSKPKEENKTIELDTKFDSSVCALEVLH